jgi:TolB-like protein
MQSNGKFTLVTVGALVAFCLAVEAADTSPPISKTKISPQPTPRLALSGFTGLGDNKLLRESSLRLMDLLLPKLSTNSAIELVERQEMTRILNEVVLANESAAANAIRVGQMIRADWLLLGSWLRLQATNMVAARLVEARSGVILDFHDDQLPRH